MKRLGIINANLKVSHISYRYKMRRFAAKVEGKENRNIVNIAEVAKAVWLPIQPTILDVKKGQLLVNKDINVWYLSNK